ncbi:hypothetical protein XENTR_v10018067 [Xenopus tropicalis]|nr:hypothetical protein XENTR_v10018067 [Xenopus tropicalis]
MAQDLQHRHSSGGCSSELLSLFFLNFSSPSSSCSFLLFLSIDGPGSKSPNFERFLFIFSCVDLSSLFCFFPL